MFLSYTGVSPSPFLSQSNEKMSSHEDLKKKKKKQPCASCHLPGIGLQSFLPTRLCLKSEATRAP